MFDLDAYLTRIGTPGPDEVGLPATVRLIEYQGTSVLVRLSTSAKDELQVVMEEAAFDAAPVALGDAVQLAWPRGEVRTLN